MSSRTLRVVMLHPDTEAEDLEDVFSEYGDIESVVVEEGRRDTARSRGRAAIVFADEASAQAAFDARDRTILDARQIRLQFVPDGDDPFA